ncbi:LLM class flavin-dependent oxidoreductase [Actinophytocola algeriensis]|uniref:Alkanesulfonate monooxygenase SsuD/methylene tetrahydromethanopterin reductase-like flavin-dependent oxidoreductase (Luciferase family) n=1 Tax=Actinophytocola algeriensis TaxID=1768010 RepID=A0A7W7VHY6_9PSEU|nr:LLM class flavin-dependent oxidoreductase [Actinophytocola algeriensis]MBB4910903.1 alkanesulfonate monooxygenase SsuD/methylene tetrahydromethanopterin reductase-like flavin-dependent oxidoreductase (luciferase family) [Actinophytocola algeriensis]MBE1473896.1 alkanesulfonate monooxygenase SsuD/methylene tetrahydromethanopterin reductase-like flavin-dependent oxidoreductase (luciferase family) [Actinophytocola algeriensis]
MIHALLIPNVGWPELLARARRLEDMGVSTVWVDDHLLNPAHPAQPWLDAWSVLPALAASTTRLRLGPLVANGILRPPAVLARHALSVDHISGGRLELGLGSGYAAADRAAGADVPFADVVATVAAALRGEPVLDGVPALAPVTGRVPLTVAAHGPRALDIAATHADRWVSYGGFGLPMSEHLALTRRRAERVGPIRRMLLAGSPAVTETPIWRSVAAVEDFTGRYREAGIDEFAFYYPPGPMWSDDDADRVFEDYVTS